MVVVLCFQVLSGLLIAEVTRTINFHQVIVEFQMTQWMCPGSVAQIVTRVVREEGQGGFHGVKALCKLQYVTGSLS